MTVIAVLAMVAAGCSSNSTTSAGEPVGSAGRSDPVEPALSTERPVDEETILTATPATDVQSSSGVAPERMYARCDSMTFDLADGDVALDDLAPLDEDAGAALEFAEAQGVPVEYRRSLYDWRVATSTAEQVALLGIPVSSRASRFAATTVLRDGDAFRTIAPGVGALGYCAMSIEADGWSRASLVIDPSTQQSPDDFELAVLATEQACANGQIPPPENVYTEVHETAATVEILVMVKSRGGNCSINPSFPISVQLKEAIGTRTISDVSVHPPQLLPGSLPPIVPTTPPQESVEEFCCDEHPVCDPFALATHHHVVRGTIRPLGATTFPGGKPTNAFQVTAIETAPIATEAPGVPNSFPAQLNPDSPFLDTTALTALDGLDEAVLFVGVPFRPNEHLIAIYAVGMVRPDQSIDLLGDCASGWNDALHLAAADEDRAVDVRFLADAFTWGSPTNNTFYSTRLQPSRPTLTTPD